MMPIHVKKCIKAAYTYVVTMLYMLCLFYRYTNNWGKYEHLICLNLNNNTFRCFMRLLITVKAWSLLK